MHILAARSQPLPFAHNKKKDRGIYRHETKTLADLHRCQDWVEAFSFQIRKITLFCDNTHLKKDDYNGVIGAEMHFAKKIVELLGPIVRSIVSLTSWLRGQLVKCFMTL